MRTGLGRTADGLTPKALVRTVAASISGNPSGMVPGATKVSTTVVKNTKTGRVEFGMPTI